MKKRKTASFMACLLMGVAFLGNVYGYGSNFIFTEKYDNILLRHMALKIGNLL